MPSHFVHLHVHTHYSLLGALPKIPELVKKAKEYGMSSLAITDNGNLYGAIEFYKECRKADIKPIIGVDAYVAARTRHDKQTGIDNRRTRVVLLAKDLEGYRNLISLITKANLEGFYYKPRIDLELLASHRSGLIAIIPASNSTLSIAVEQNDRQEIERITTWYQKYFREKVYVEITHHPHIEGHTEKMERLYKIAQEASIPVVASQNVFYLNKDDQKAWETLLSVQTNQASQDRQFEAQDDFSFISGETIESFFKENPKAVENSAIIAEQCNLDLSLGSWVFPQYVTEKGQSYESALRSLVEKGLVERSITNTKEVSDRIDYELDIINRKGYAPYFLVVSDLLQYARKNKIFSTTRGSAAGSLVSYLTFITTVNPLEYKLPFERFLNPHRPSPPDIDMDIADNRRDEMIEYVRNRYGDDKVAQIGTFGTMMARGSVRDVARALGFPYEVGDRIAKLIPMGSQGFPMTLDIALEKIPELASMYKKDAPTKQIIDMAKKIEGCARHISVHAAGVVIAPKPLTDFVPLQLDPKGENKVITQYDMHAVEDAGLLKFDFLGIRNLSILADAVEKVALLEGKEIDIENIPLDDKATFNLLAQGETTGIFQLNGSGMTRHLKELQPSTIHDINAMVALYRPGPMEVIPEYIRRKNNKALVSYLDPRMKRYLEESYGLIVYQDDLLFSAVELAGYSWAEADKFRKAVGKKIPAEMAAQKEKFSKGIVENGQTKEFAEKLWKLFEPFQAYGFNKAHAASYGRVAYQTAYMKANYPAIYMASILTAESGDVEKIGEVVAECSRMNIPVLPPSINESFEGFTVVKGDIDSIRFGLTTIKNFGEGIAHVIIQEREQHGRFKSLMDFLERITDRNLNKKSLESLIKAGALDDFEDRGRLLGNLDLLLAFNREKIKQDQNQNSLFSTSSESGLTLSATNPIPAIERLQWEKELLGLYISGHPLESYQKSLHGIPSIDQVKSNLREGVTGVVAGIVEEVRMVYTKKNEAMGFVRISDTSSGIEMVFFPKVYQEYQEHLSPGNAIKIQGRLSNRNGTQSIIVEKLKPLERDTERTSV